LALAFGEPQQAVRLHGVRRAVDRIETERDPLAFADPADGVVQLLGPCRAAELQRQVTLAVHPCFRHLRVQLEGPPPDGRRDVGPFGQCPLQPPFADKTPRTDCV